MVFNTQNEKKQRLVADQVTPQLLEDVATSANRLKKKACSFFSINLKKSVNNEPYSADWDGCQNLPNLWFGMLT